MHVVAVDPDDDTLRRYVVRHYRYDPDRHERRHVIVAAFDNEFEWDACMDATETALRAGWDTSEAVDPREHVSGTVYEPGYRRLQQNGRLRKRRAWDSNPRGRGALAVFKMSGSPPWTPSWVPDLRRSVRQQSVAAEVGRRSCRQLQPSAPTSAISDHPERTDYKKTKGPTGVWFDAR